MVRELGLYNINSAKFVDISFMTFVKNMLYHNTKVECTWIILCHLDYP